MARILLVEDNGGVQKAIIRRLERHGHEVRMRTSQDSWVDEERPDVVLLDINPDGWEAIRVIRAHVPEAKVIVISGDDERDTREAMSKFGAVGWCPKPFSTEQLVSVIEEALK